MTKHVSERPANQASCACQVAGSRRDSPWVGRVIIERLGLVGDEPLGSPVLLAHLAKSRQGISALTFGGADDMLNIERADQIFRQHLRRYRHVV
jgi:hypothetical protein